eukprot:1099024-Alexandrium_andersonii.AAC.1
MAQHGEARMPCCVASKAPHHQQPRRFGLQSLAPALPRLLQSAASSPACSNEPLRRAAQVDEVANHAERREGAP